MTLMKPTVDYVFKKIFGNEEKPEILISFLNAILNCPPNNLITSVEIKNPENTVNYLKQKFSILDIKALTNRKELVDIEIQVARVYDMPERVMFYLSQMLGTQLVPDPDETIENYKPKIKYTDLNKAISIILLNFNLPILEKERYHSIFRFSSVETGVCLTDIVEAHFIELPKFQNCNTDNMEDIWLEFIKKPDSDVISSKKDTLQPVNIAYRELNRLSLDETARITYESRQKSIRDEASFMYGAHKEGVEIGMEIGMEKGMEKGMLGAITNLIKNGLEKSQILSLLECSETLYEKAYAQVHSSS